MRHYASFVMALLLTFVMTMGCSVSRAQTSSSRYSKANSVITVNTTVANQTINLGKNTTIKILGGKFRNCRLVGNNTSIVVQGSGCAFENCSFSGSFASSSLMATNFGCVPDMQSVPYTWKSKAGNSVKTKIRRGTDNKKALGSIAQFCSNSRGVTITFNGSFYTPVVDNVKGKSEGTSNYLTVNSAKELTLTGGTLIQGIWFYNCSDLYVHDVNFVGLHEVHDFPPIYYQASSFSNTGGSFYKTIRQAGYTKDNTFNITADQYSRLGIAGTSTMRFMSTNGGSSQNIRVEDCHFEMRTGGIGTGSKSARSDVRNITIKNCDFSHIYYQPVGFASVSNAVVENVVADYCLQAVDIGRWANHVTIKESKFLNCHTGPKQQLNISSKEDVVGCYDNSIENCYFQINNRMLYIDSTPYILLAGQAQSGSTFTVRNTTFDVNTNVATEGLLCRASNLLLDCVTLNINCRTDREKSDVPRLFNTGGAILLGENYLPQITMNNSTINANNTRIGYIASPTGPTFGVTLNNVKFQGTGQCSYPAFSSINRLALNNVSFGLNCPNSFAEKIPNISFNAVSCLNIGNMMYNSGGLTDKLSINIRNSKFKSQGRFLNLHKATSADVQVTGCEIDCTTFFRIVDDPKNLSMDIRSNSVQTSSSEVFAGLESAQRSFVPAKVNISANRFSSASNASLYSKSAGNAMRKVFSGNTLSGRLKQP